MTVKCETRLDPAGARGSAVSAACRLAHKRMKAVFKGITAIAPPISSRPDYSRSRNP